MRDQPHHQKHLVLYGSPDAPRRPTGIPQCTQPFPSTPRWFSVYPGIPQYSQKASSVPRQPPAAPSIPPAVPGIPQLSPARSEHSSQRLEDWTPFQTEKRRSRVHSTSPSHPRIKKRLLNTYRNSPVVPSFPQFSPHSLERHRLPTGPEVTPPGKFSRFHCSP